MKYVEQLDILIPLQHDIGCYNIYFDGNKVISEEIGDPIELVADISNEYNNWNLNFDNANIRLFTNVLYVDETYVKNNPDLVNGNRVCIYENSFRGILEEFDFKLPVPQYCSRLFMLYINSCKYLDTIQNSKMFNTKNP